MVILRGKLEVEERKWGTLYTAHLNVDEICQDDTPYVNFVVYCIKHKLLVYDEEENKYEVDHRLLVDLEFSEDDNKNDNVTKMLRKFNVTFI